MGEMADETVEQGMLADLLEEFPLCQKCGEYVFASYDGILDRDIYKCDNCGYVEIISSFIG